MIYFRPLEEKDFADVSNYVCSPEVARYLTWRPCQSETEVRKIFEKMIQCKDFPNTYLAIEYHEEVIGTLHLIFRAPGYVQYGFGVTPIHWGKGLGTLIVEKTFEYLTNTRWTDELKEIWADVHVDNVHAHKVLNNNKFIEAGPLKENPERIRYVYVWDEQK